MVKKKGDKRYYLLKVPADVEAVGVANLISSTQGPYCAYIVRPQYTLFNSEVPTWLVRKFLLKKLNKLYFLFSITS